MVRRGQMAEEDKAHLCHFKDALWVQAASAHLPRAGDCALVRDRDNEACHRAGLLLQSGIHHMPVAHLHRKPAYEYHTLCPCRLLSVSMWAYLTQGHYTGNVLYVKSHTVVGVIGQLNLLSSLFVSWYVNFGNPVSEVIRKSLINFLYCKKKWFSAKGWLISVWPLVKAEVMQLSLNAVWLNYANSILENEFNLILHQHNTSD